MSGVKRVFVEKKKPYAVKAKELHDEIAGYLGIKTISQVRVLIRYDIENLSEETYTQALTTVSTSGRSIRARRFSKASSLPGAST